MKNKALHIVALNIPYPANYGGVIDIFYKLKALKDLGIKIHLHCHKYDREETNVLDILCSSIHYYPRKMNWFNLFSKIPFIVNSRKSKNLLKNLEKINAPILFEGLHTTYYLNHSKINQRPQFVRAHNIEADYYKMLAIAEKNLIPKLYFYTEHLKIKAYEKRLKNADGILSISQKDHLHFNGIGNSHYIKAFHPNKEVSSKTGLGKYAIYHGNLSVAENENAALYLIKHIFKKIDYPFVIAGHKPGKHLRNEITKYNHVRLVENPEEALLDNLIKNAQIQVLYTQQATGIKLKLLKSLYHGRHCIVNNKMIIGTELENVCHIVEKPEKWIAKIKELENIPLSYQDIEIRKKILEKFNCIDEAKKIIQVIYPQEE